MLFKDRQEAGKKLAQALSGSIYESKNTVILALPRGGVVVGAEIAKAFELPLDIVVSRKIGAPGNPEFAIGAVSEKSEPILDIRTVREYGISKEYISKEAILARLEIKRRNTLYRQGRKPLNLKNKIVILTDDGIATGATMESAVLEIREQNPKEIILAIPVAPPDAIEKFKDKVNKIICLSTPSPFFAVGNFYENFEQVSDEEVIELLS